MLLIAQKREEVSTREILTAMGIELHQQNKSMAMRVGGILNRAKWVLDGKFSGGDRRGLSRYRNPEKLSLLSGEP